MTRAQRLTGNTLSLLTAIGVSIGCYAMTNQVSYQPPAVLRVRYGVVEYLFSN